MNAHCSSGCGDLFDANEPPVGNYFVSAYPPFSAWAKNELHHVERVLSAPPADREPLGLYVHVPFCVERCQYCYYLSYDDKRPSDVDAYLDAVVQELALYRDRPALAGQGLSFVYFGGGTPSLLSARVIERFLGRLQALLPWDHVKEVTFECAPRSVTREKMSILRDRGVTRVSLGVQQLDDRVLQQNGRVHRVSDVERAYEDIRSGGFPVVNLDLMVGLIGETEATVQQTLERIIQMQPESVTIYQLEIPHNTPLYRALDAGTLSVLPADWATKRRRLLACFARLEQTGYVLRSAYTAVRDAQAHKFVYQDAQYFGADLIGLGASSFSYLKGVHYQNLASFNAYLECVDSGGHPAARAYALTEEERMIREFVLQLKLGFVSVGHFRVKFGVDIRSRFAEPLDNCAQDRWLVHGDQGVTLTREGLARVDRLIPAFYARRHRP